MMSRHKAEPQLEVVNPCTLYTYTTMSHFELFSTAPSAQEHLERGGYEELPGSFGILRSYKVPDSSKISHKYAVLVSHPQQDHLILLRENEYPAFMQKWANLAPILPNYLPEFQGQAWLPTLRD